jgi:hypothetical protein
MLVRFVLWGAFVGAITAVEVLGGRYLRRFHELGVPAAIGAALIAGAAAGLAT